MERTNTRNGDGRRLVFGFDPGCMTCSGLARSIEEAVGDKLELRSLTDPGVEHWRKQALGENASWAPTLVEVNGSVVRAWTGVRMEVHLARRLGPAATWRVAKILGEIKGSKGTDNSPYAGLSRSQSLKAWVARLSGCRCSRVRGPSPPRTRRRSIGFPNSRLLPLKSSPRRRPRPPGRGWPESDTCVGCFRLVH